MKIHVEQKDHVSWMQILGEMNIYSASELKSGLIDVLIKSQEMVIDLSAVDEMDCAGVQLLILIKREALKTGKVLRLVQHSPAALEAMDALNLFAYFGDPSVVPANDRGMKA